MKLWMMVRSGMKKNRSSSITLVILIMIATLFMNIGLNVVTKLGTFVDDKKESLNGADFVLLGAKTCEEDAIKLFQMMEGYEDLSSEDAVLYENAYIQDEAVETKGQSMGILLLNMDAEHKYSKLVPLDESGEVKENSIILPYSLKTGSGYEVGDEVRITFNGQEYEFEVYAFAEDVLFASAMNIDIFKCFISNTKFQEIYQAAVPANQQVFINVRLEKGYSSNDFDKQFTNVCSTYESKDLISAMGLNYETMKIGGTATVAILMAILIMFSILVIVISLVVIRFSVATYIEEDIKNIGSMEAIGFTSSMIRSALLVQFLIITLIGYILGTVTSGMITEIVSAVVASAMGLDWNQGLTPDVVIITFLILMVVILSVTYKVTARIKKVTPIMALRNGIETYHFEKNHLPFETTHGNLHWIMGMKGLLQNRKQNISIGIITTLMSFCIIFVIGLYNSFVVSKTSLVNIIGIEKPEIAVQYTGEDYLDFFEELSKTEGVRKTLRYTDRNITIKKGENETSTVMRICNDYSLMETDILAEGRYPEYENEIALSYATNKDLGAKIGDVVNIVSGDSTYEFVVVGFLQHITYLGLSASVTEEGMLRCEPSFQLDQLYLYLDSGYETDDVIDSIEGAVYAHGGEITNVEDSFETMLSTLYKGISLLCTVICIITAIVTTLILYYLVKMKITKERVSFGIQKAVGFTTGQLILHTILAFVPVVGLSSIIGAVLATVLVNPITAGILNSLANVKNCNIEMNPIVVAVAILAITLLAAVTTALVSLRIRKLEAKELVME